VPGTGRTEERRTERLQRRVNCSNKVVNYDNYNKTKIKTIYRNNTSTLRALTLPHTVPAVTRDNII